MKAVLIDHDDSFTFNLEKWVAPICSNIEVIHHSRINFIKSLEFIVLSPGPKSPNDYPKSLEFLKNLDGNVPVLGVCLGMQMMANSASGLVTQNLSPVHGKTSRLDILNGQLSKLQNIEVARYHSLRCDQLNEFDILAESHDDKVPMWIKHRSKNWMGLQFHPESFLTLEGAAIRSEIQKWVISL